ncbi:MAG TPA: HAMP domain-containing sensor histidine kinase [Sulfurovum sp.]|jgi:two-component system OmpR family sensor kinase|nr:MAG: hypothetical protein B7Y63_07615 [Sulfurovum sp. 35-42-20]OYZ26893.1 MAG: hypothetical protein B7Y23_00740 [Sulfurovum sp. 16-42-52]OYZ49552.1 MAG: hypothetical protein B7Y13_04205 [Sulfurovum sp. 24-42-9]OZA45892.1 MAG: hypothetical protein B7X80_04015 [Sulfurovum sp. 17-42-90]OZA59882.1 MAG: hypothetical protein B7X69_06120 [Sulfurovum sp. 39-42-12]HQR74547.1 HAMP domain-containing sensor histidine kinase [Sulfurovum sp.]
MVGTALLKSEKQSFIRFLLIYLGSTLLLFSLAAGSFYLSQKHHLLDEQHRTLEYEAEEMKMALRALHSSFDNTIVYPVRPKIDSALYDLDKQYIFGTRKDKIPLNERHYADDEERLFLLSRVEPYYLGAAYLLVSKPLDKAPLQKLQKNIGLFMLGAGVFFSLLGLFLGKLFIAPMRDSMQRMNHFIQDTTHELNTPISTILTNIEMIETLGGCEYKEELKRIEIASKTLSHLYDDLSYLNLNHHYYRHIESLDVSQLAAQRVLYFTAMAHNKGLTLQTNIDEGIVLEMDKNDFTRLLDNLITNAIKYNKPQGLITVTMTKEFLSLVDTGVGIPKKDLGTITCRFRRANQSEGGFGIGLDIVNQVVTYYGFRLKIDSQPNEGTKVVIRWKK